MGTTVQVTVRREGHIAATRALFEDIEECCSRFRSSSELSQINSSQATDIALTVCMTDVLGIAADMRTRTDGLIDAGLGAVVSGWGYNRSFDEIGDTTTPILLAPKPDWSVADGTLHRSWGTKLDLGGIAKGWACDRAVNEGGALIVNAGGDVRSASPEAVVEIMDPWAHCVARVPLGVGALATSSTTRRRWNTTDGEAHHLIDPRTMSPSVSPIVSATVVASTAVEAEAGAKAMLLHGVGGLAWASSRPWINGALAVWSDGSVYATSDLEMQAA